MGSTIVEWTLRGDKVHKLDPFEHSSELLAFTKGSYVPVDVSNKTLHFKVSYLIKLTNLGCASAK
jgi:hypothetical protein